MQHAVIAVPTLKGGLRFLYSPPSSRKTKVCKQHPFNSTVVLLAHRHKRQCLILVVSGAHARACGPRGAVQYANRLDFGPGQNNRHIPCPQSREKFELGRENLESGRDVLSFKLLAKT